MATNEKQIEMQVEAALARVPRMTDPDDLVQLHRNCLAMPSLTDNQIERLTAAIEARLRTIAPASATRTFGAKDVEGRSVLQEIHDNIIGDFDLSGNTVGSGVKTGGDMISGKYLVDVYISYKAEDGWHVGLGWLQDDPTTKPYFKVFCYQNGRSNSASLQEELFSLGERASAVETYRIRLRGLTGQGRNPGGG